MLMGRPAGAPHFSEPGQDLGVFFVMGAHPQSRADDPSLSDAVPRLSSVGVTRKRQLRTVAFRTFSVEHGRGRGAVPH
jgi:hypothetical protein